MIVAEVKEGRAELNRGARDPRVLEAALVRFGCCDPQVVERVVEELLRRARAATGHGHSIRLVVLSPSWRRPERERTHDLQPHRGSGTGMARYTDGHSALTCMTRSISPGIPRPRH